MFLDSDDKCLKHTMKTWNEYTNRKEPYGKDEPNKVEQAGYIITQLMGWVPTCKPPFFKDPVNDTKQFIKGVAYALTVLITHAKMKKGNVVMEFWVHYMENCSPALRAKLEEGH